LVVFYFFLCVRGARGLGGGGGGGTPGPPRTAAISDKDTERHEMSHARTVALGLLAVMVGVSGAMLLTRRAPRTVSSQPPPATVAAGQARDGKPTPGRRAAARSFVPARGKAPAVQNDPAAPDYDAFRLYKVADVTVGRIYEGETRDPTWAPQMERRITETISNDLSTTGVAAKVSTVECRKATCQIEIQADDDQALSNANVLVFQYSGANVTQPSGIDHTEHTAHYYQLFGSEVRDLDSNREFAQKQRTAMIARMRALAAEQPDKLKGIPIPSE
jgi:hypothetical protein